MQGVPRTTGELKAVDSHVQYLERALLKVRRERDEARAEVKVLSTRVAELERENQTLRLRLEELERLVFRPVKRAMKPESQTANEKQGVGQNQPVKRPPESYRRRIPAEEEVTKHQHHGLPCCLTCGSLLENRQTLTRFEEELVLAAREVIKHTIGTGFCPRCHVWRSAIPVSAQPVCLGEQLKAFVGYSLVLARLSARDLQALLGEIFGLEISLGEMMHILAEQAKTLTPLWFLILHYINQQASAGTDETSYRVQASVQGNHLWVRTGCQSEHAVYLVGQSRGKDNAKVLREGASPEMGEVSDDYAAYDHLPAEYHQRCLAHILRKLRDLANSGQLEKRVLRHSRQAYTTFASLDRDIRQAWRKASQTHAPTDGPAYAALKERLFCWARPKRRDPKKLSSVKAAVREHLDSYLTCLRHPAIPPDNNHSERKLRPLAQKRKNSFGVKTQAGADTLSVLATVLYSLRWTNPKPLAAYRALLQDPTQAETLLSLQ